MNKATQVSPALEKRITHAKIFARLHLWGIVGSMIMFVLALTPSLLPRTWFYQGIISGWAAGFGYLIGIALHWFYRRFIRGLRPWLHASNWSTRQQKWARRILITLGTVWVLVMVGFSYSWQLTLARAAGTKTWTGWQVVAIPVVAFAMFFLVIGIFRFLNWSANLLFDATPQFIKPRARSVLAWVIVLMLAVWFFHNAVPGAIVGVGERVFSAQNRDPDPAVTAPTQPERSGSPDSAVDFDGVGFYGSRFVAGGATAEELTAATGKKAKEPIRVYAGLGNALDPQERAQLLIDELERTNAKDRKALLFMMTTGTGWVSAYATQSFELLYGGDTAIAAGQYSAMPSALHFLAGGEQVQAANSDLLSPLINWWNELPEADRPKLYLYGESLGSTGVEASFSGLRDVANSVDGILLTGSPHFNPLRSQFVERRDPGTTETNPVYGDGLMVRFASDAEQVRPWVTKDDEDWAAQRLLYIHHPSDPVSWWSFKIAFQEPDWLSEPLPEGQERAMTWMPLVSFLQVSADLPVAANVPDGYGHNYGDSVLVGFAAIGGLQLSDAELNRYEDILSKLRGDTPK